MKRFLFALGALMLLLTSCGQTNPEGKTKLMKVNLGFALTKVTDTAFEYGDEAGVFMDGCYDNIRMSYDGHWTAAQQMYWPDKETPQDFYAYAPYTAGAALSSLTFQTKSDQSAQADYKASDLVRGELKQVAPTEDLINIPTSHILSNMLIRVAPGDGFTAESLAASTISVQVMNLKTAAFVNLRSGSSAATGDATTVKPYYNGEYWRAVVVPQTVADGSQLIVVTVDGVPYTLKRGFTFLSGKRHTFTVTVNRTTSGINIGIGDWDDDGTDYGGEAE